MTRQIKLLAMVGNDVAGELVFSDALERNVEFYDAVTTNNFTIMEVSPEDNITIGHFWNGTEFVEQPE
jgi:hypothetical protein